MSTLADYIARVQKREDPPPRGALSVVDHLALALKMIHDETADYLRLNLLGGYYNQSMREARAALEAYDKSIR